jgi:hypothetical protein
MALASPAGFAQIYGGTQLGYARGTLGGFGVYGGWGSTANLGTVQGSVQSLDFERGKLSMRTTQGLLTLNARPQDLVGLNPGDVAGVTFLDYGGSLWLEPGAGGLYGGGLAGDFGFAGEVTGTVQRVDRQRGLIQVAGRTLRAHPEDVSGVYPGQFLSIGYVQVGNTAWTDSGVGSGVYGGGIYGGGLYGGGGYGGGIYGTGRYGTGYQPRVGGYGDYYGNPLPEVKPGATMNNNGDDEAKPQKE